MKNLPAKRYPIFISYFEAEVTKAQKAIEDLRALEVPYSIAREALLYADLNHDVKLSHYGNTVYLKFTMEKDEIFEDHAKLISALGDKAKALGHDGQPSVGDWWLDRTFSWSFRKLKRDYSIYLKVTIPDDSLRYDILTKEEVSTSSIKYFRERNPSAVKPFPWSGDDNRESFEEIPF